MRLLDRLFASAKQLSLDDRELFGAFVLSPKARFGDVAQAYGLEPAPAEADLTVGEMLQREFGAAVGIGDRLTRGRIELVVRALDAAQRVTEVGLVLEPTGTSWRPPVSGRKLLATLRRWWWRAGGAVPEEQGR